MKKKIKLLVLDVDGTLTDGKIYIGPEGEAVKAFDVKDGYALAVLLPKMGIEPLVITGRKSKIVGKYWTIFCWNWAWDMKMWHAWEMIYRILN